MNFEEELLLLIKSRYPLIWIETYDEEFVSNALFEISSNQNYKFYNWTVTKGICQSFGECLYDSKDPLKMIKNLHDLIDNVSGKAFFALYDFEKYLENPTILRYFKEALEKIKGSEKTLIMVSPSYKEIKDLYSYVTRIAGGYPDEEQIIKTVNEQINFFRKNNAVVDVDIKPEMVKKLVTILKGLTFQQVKNIINKTIVEDMSFDYSDFKKIEEYKKELFDRDGLLEYYSAVSKDEVGGFENLKKWISNRKKFFFKKDSNLSSPKGIMILGVPGSGKSLAAKTVSKEFDIPLYRLDITRLYSKFIGETEENLRKTFEILKKLSPVCVWIDEIEKIFSASSGEVDGGVSKRILGSFLTWMQERKDDVFLIATSNDISSIPPEFLRKGRFDEIFFSPLPDEKARKEILNIHLKKRDLTVSLEKFAHFVSLSEGFSGSEIEQCVVAALYSHSENSPFEKELEIELKNSSPLSRIKPEQIESIVKWARERRIPNV